MPVRVGTVRLVVAALVAVTLAACTTTHRTEGATKTSVSTGSAPTSTSSSGVTESRPGSPSPNYRARFMARPLHLPKLRPGQACPTSGGTLINNGDFYGAAQGAEPVHPLGPDTRGVAYLISHTNGPPGWLAFKSIWFSQPRYRGPFLVRLRRIDHPGPVGVLERPGLTSFFVPSGPPGPTDIYDVDLHGYRSVPGGTWVKAPGCIAWQVDGLGFSHVVVVRVVCRPPTATTAGCVMPRRPAR